MAFVTAIISNDIDTVKRYIQQVNNTDSYDSTTLIWASYYSSTEVCKLLIDNGADVNRANIYAYTALICASLNGHTETCKLLLENGADVNHVDKNGDTALSLAGKKL